MTTEPMFPILNDPVIKCIPWAAIQPHEKQATHNHSQTLRGLASRGGLDVKEAFYIMTNKPWGYPKRSPVVDAAFRLELMRLVYAFEKSRSGSNDAP